MHSLRKWRAVVGLVVLLLACGVQAAEQIEFVQEKLENGLQVIYAPLRQAPVVHVRVVYHVGSRDERADRQGFAHMFEHMMFRGSEHVKAEEHMKLIGMVGGYSNAFTSFDQTVYVNTVPSNQVELALYLEADRMASFKVSAEIFDVERRVVVEEWGRRQNQPYGTVFEDFLKLAFTAHPYRWTVIGNMDQLRAASAGELQEFFNRYYVPNNAVLVIAGDIDVEVAKKLARKYFGWLPKGAEVKREIAGEPAQTAGRRQEVGKAVPLARIMVGYKTPAYRSDERNALSLLATIMGGGRSGRLDNLLVNGANPVCVNAGASDMALEDAGMFIVSGTVLSGRNPDDVEKLLNDAVAAVVEKGVTQEELEKAKTQAKVGYVSERETAESIGSALGQEAVFGGDAGRVNTELEKINGVTVADIQAVARKYLGPSSATTYRVKADAGAKEVPAASQAVGEGKGGTVAPRAVSFPADYPAKPPIADSALKASFAKGTETTINGVKVIVMPERRLPSVSWVLTMRAGGYSDPKGKEGLGGLTAGLVRRGCVDLGFIQLNGDLESRGISISVNEGGDTTQLGGSCLTEQLGHAIMRSRQILLSPSLAAGEYEKLRNQTLSGLKLRQAQPETAASQELAGALFGGSVLGRYSTPASVEGMKLEDVKDCYKRLYGPEGAIFVISGDITVERGQEMAKKLLEGWEAAKLPGVDYALGPAPAKRRIIVVDRPEGKQSMIRISMRSYSIRSEEKFAGSLASSILSSGINSRLGRYVRAEKGYAYSVYGVFRAGRHSGEFTGGTETGLKTTADAIEAMFKVFGDMARDGVKEDELQEAKLRVVGSLVMGMQTMEQQAGRRVEGILNGYPIDYFDVYPQRISAVTAEQVKEVVGKYVKEGEMVVVVVSPAAAVKEQLSRLGEVEVVPMPAQRQGAAK